MLFLIIGFCIYYPLLIGALLGTKTFKGKKFKGIMSGVICFIVSAIPWFFFSQLMLALFLHPRWNEISFVLSVYGICALIAAIFGVSVYSEKKSLIIISIILLALVVIGMPYLLFFRNPGALSWDLLLR
jgi:hypothetical protein